MRTLIVLLFLSIQFPLLAASPEVFDLHRATEKNTPTTFALIGRDADGDELTYSIVTTPNNGSVSINGDKVTYTPKTNFVDNETFTYKATDGDNDSATSTISMTVFANYLDIAKQLGQDINGEASGDTFGSSVSLSADGQTVAIRATNDGYSSGHVRIFSFQANSWQQLGQDIDGENSRDDFGSSVSLSADGKIVAIGAYGNDDNGYSSGHVRIFSFQANSWQQLGQDIDGENFQDDFGSSVSLSADGKTVAIGASGNDDNGYSSGHVRIFSFQANSWQQLGQDIDGENSQDYFGSSVSLSADGKIVAIGASGNDSNGDSSGQVRIFSFQSNSWQQLGQDLDGENSQDDFGSSVSLSADGQTVAIGAPSFTAATGAPSDDVNGDDSGYVRLFKFIDNVWVQKGDDIVGEAWGDFSGVSVSLSADGKTVAIGASGNDSNGDSSGHVRIFSFQANSWQQLGQDLDGENGDQYGNSVSLSADGQIVAIGARFNDGNSENSGHVRTFELTGMDSDFDGVLDTADAYPLVAIGDLVDTDSDGAPDTCDEACLELGMEADDDDDNDSIPDINDINPLEKYEINITTSGELVIQPIGAPYSVLSFSVNEQSGNPLTLFSPVIDIETPGIHTVTYRAEDAYGNFAEASQVVLVAYDTDRDGLPDTCENINCEALELSEDTDDDNDTIADAADAYPLIAIGELTDTDSDGGPDTCNEACVALGMAADTDDDNDGIVDTADAYPLVATGELTDTDSDGAPDVCDEACVSLGMAADTDDDNDGILDTADAYPLVAIGELTDTDSDGAPDSCDNACVASGMAADADDDNDGVLDTTDKYPLVVIGELTDTDSDGAPDTCNEACIELGMAADTDDDNDGIADTTDAYPLIAIGELTDTDSDGAPDTCDAACLALGMAADTDDDNDGISDELEVANGLDSLNSIDAALDADNDGVSNIDEINAGSDINTDDQPPVFIGTVSDIEVISTGLATLVELVNPTASDVNSDVVVTNDSNGEFPVGISTVTYTATDEAGNTATLTQQVNVLPYIVIGTGRSIGDGQTIEIDISLNGTAATYPVAADIVTGGTASDGDFTLSRTSISITEGLTQTVELTAIDDGFGDNEETVSLSLANIVNAGVKPGTDSEQTFTITEEQILPTVSVSVVQDAVISRTVDKLSNALFDIDIEDPNGLDSLIIEWSGIANISEVDSSTDLTLDTSNMEAGVYVLTLSVTDNDVAGDNVVNQLITIKVIESLPELTTADTDGDGVSDIEEGLGDSDNDGIADYLDNTPQINLQPIGETYAQAQDGVTLALGATALAGNDNSIAIDPSSLPEDTSYEVEEVFDFTLSGLAVGASYELVLPLSQVIPEDAVYRKLTDNGWVDFVEDANNAVHSATVLGNCPDTNSDLWEAGLVPGGNCLKLTIQDGSSNDTDGLENGTVEDPSGIAVVKPTPTPTATPTPTPNPTTPSSGGGSSGGSNSIYILILLWLMVIGRRLIVRAKY